MLSAGTQREHRQNLGERIDGQPEPEHLRGAAEPGSNFVQLQVWDVQVVETALVQGLCVPASTGKPGGDGRLPVAEDPFGSRWVQPFGQRRQDHADEGRGSLQTIQRGVASSSEGRAASLTAKGLDALSLAMLAIPDQRVDVSIGDAAIRALRVGTGVALGLHALGCSPPAFHLSPGAYRNRR
jgi:hypothetical protein